MCVWWGVSVCVGGVSGGGGGCVCVRERERESTGFWNIRYECLEIVPAPIEKGYGYINKIPPPPLSLSLDHRGEKSHVLNRCRKLAIFR